MSTNARWMISLGWGIPALVALTIFLLRSTFKAAGEHAGGILLGILIVPAFLLALTFLTAGSVSGLRAWLVARNAVGLGDRALLAVGLIGALISWYFPVRIALGALLGP